MRSGKKALGLDPFRIALTPGDESAFFTSFDLPLGELEVLLEDPAIPCTAPPAIVAACTHGHTHSSEYWLTYCRSQSVTSLLYEIGRVALVRVHQVLSDRLIEPSGPDRLSQFEMLEKRPPRLFWSSRGVLRQESPISFAWTCAIRLPVQDLHRDGLVAVPHPPQ